MISIDKDTKNQIINQGGVYFIQELIKSKKIDTLINNSLPGRHPQAVYSDSDIVLGLSYSIYSGASFLEDLNFVRDQVNKSGVLQLPSPDVIKYRSKQLVEQNVINTKGQGVIHYFNISTMLNQALIKLGTALNPQWKIQGQTIDYDNTIIVTTKGDSNRAYKDGCGYQPGAIFIGRNIVYVEGRNGNSPSIYQMKETLDRGITLIEEEEVKIKYIRIDTAGYQGDVMKYLREKGIIYYIRGKDTESIRDLLQNDIKWEKGKLSKKVHVEYWDQPWYAPGKDSLDNPCRLILYRYKREPGENLDLFEGEYRYYSILTTDYESTAIDVIKFYNQRGSAEQNFDRLKNDFNWSHPPFDTLAQNTVYLIFTAMAAVIYYWMLKAIGKYFKELDENTRIKRFILFFVNVAAKWIRQGRRNILKIYTTRPYEKLLADP
jgi:hypothetical protein